MNEAPQSPSFNMSEITLRKFSDSDLALLERWLRAEHVARWFERPESWLREAREREGEFRFIRHFIAERKAAPFGFCQYYRYADSGESWHGALDASGAYSLDYLIGESEYLGRGLGKAMVRELLELISAQDDARLVIAQPEGTNAASRATLLACGFEYDETNDVYLLRLRD